MPRIQGLAETGVLTGDLLVKGVAGEVHSVTIAWRGAAVGDILAYLLDAITDTSANSGTHEVIFIAPTANGTITKEWPQGKRFDTGIFYKEGAAANVFTEITYK